MKELDRINKLIELNTNMMKIIELNENEVDRLKERIKTLEEKQL